MSSQRWPEELTMKFVNEYVAHECLWNFNHPNYKNRAMRGVAYDEISENMNLTDFAEKEVVTKIKNLRSTYSQEIRKIKESKKIATRPELVYTPMLKWFSTLHAALCQIHEDDGTPLPSYNQEIDQKTFDSFIEDSIEIKDEKISSRSCFELLPQVSEDEQKLEEELNPTLLGVIQPSRPKKIKPDRSTSASTKIRKSEAHSSISDPAYLRDEFTVFGEYVANELRKLTPREQTVAKHFINNILFEVAIGKYDSGKICNNLSNNTND